MNNAQMTTLAVVAVAVVVIGGGVALAAKNAEPGDSLYSLRASLYGDVYSDADTDTDFRSARETYDEAADLESRGMLTTSERARLSATYSMHVSNLSARIAELEAEGDVDAALRLRTMVRAMVNEYDDVFSDIDEGSSSSAMSSEDDDNGSTSSAMSGDNDEDDDASSAGATTSAGGTTSVSGQSSSIFTQPSSSVTSA